jgi:DNA-binding response OmpR family regulator
MQSNAPHPDEVADAGGSRPGTDPSAGGSVSGSFNREVVGAEILLVDGDAQARQRVTDVLSAAELNVTAVGEPEQAHDLLTRRFFSVVMVDLDTPAPGAGLDIAAAVRIAAPTSALVLLTQRSSHDDAVAAMRLGAVDVILKGADLAAGLEERIFLAASRALERRQIDGVLRDVRDVYEELLKNFFDAERRALEMDERLSGRAERGEADSGAEIRILVVARLVEVAEEMAAHAQPPYVITAARSGGEALDRCGSSRYHVVMISDDLHDLPPSMVARSIQAASAETMVVGLTGTSTGAVLDMIEGDRRVRLAERIGSPDELLATLDGVTEVFRVRERERRYLQEIRERHYDFLRRYAMLRPRIDRLVGGE